MGQSSYGNKFGGGVDYGFRSSSARRILTQNQQDIVKLRLKGKGSGFKEGPNHQESQEPLGIYVTSKVYDRYLHACTLVQELILNVYEEYKGFCAKYKRKSHIDFDLQIKKEETVSRPFPIPE